MSVSELSASTQNYLKALWSLQEWTDEAVTPTNLAAKVGLRTSTVSDAVRKLAEQGLVEHAPYGAVSLTEEGHRLAVAMVRRHRLIETFLVEVLGYGWDEVHDEADSLEHAVSDVMVERMDDRLGHPTRDPHGDPIPGADGRVQRPDAVLLSEVAPGSRARVERISDSDPELLRFLSERGVRIGDRVRVGEGAPFSGAVEVLLEQGRGSFPLGEQAAGAIWVSVT